MSETSSDENEKPLTFWQVMFSTLAGAFGVQAYENCKRDFTRGYVIHFIAAGVIFTAGFFGGVALLVNFILSQTK